MGKQQRTEHRDALPSRAYIRTEAPHTVQMEKAHREGIARFPWCFSTCVFSSLC